MGEAAKGKVTRLYRCWLSMKHRASTRTNCKVCDEWLDYSQFRAWSLSNGYASNLLLCRIGDSGNYEPSNAMWDTRASNMVQAHAKVWKFKYEGELVEIYNLSDFCRIHKLDQSYMTKVHNNPVTKKGKVRSCKGYTAFNT